ncbi:MAG: hypothetical protein II926_07860 [Bacteroidales bacterium]|jgi:hypothetical protein|nr:hypothetical protein [Bacteroidales bacterium]
MQKSFVVNVVFATFTFDGVQANILVLVQNPQVNDYKTSTGWKNFTDFVGVY